MYHYVWDIEQNMQCGIMHTNVNFQQHGKLSSAEIADAYIMLFRIAPLSLWTITLQNNSEHYASAQFWTTDLRDTFFNFRDEIEIFTSLSCGSRSRFSRSRFFIIESHVSRRDRDFSSLNLVVRDEIENFHHWILKFETRSRCFSFLSSTNFKPQSREQRMIFP